MSQYEKARDGDAKKLNLLWIDISVSGELAEVPKAFAEECEIVRVAADNAETARRNHPAVDALVVDFDYPDIDGLKLLEGLKRQWASTPVIMVTVHHSEEIAVWALRARVWDYLVRPAPAGDVFRCLDGLKRILRLRRGQGSREVCKVESPLPRDARFRAQRPRQRVEPAVAFMNAHYHRPIREAEMAALCNLSAHRFSRIFREEMGSTFQAWLLKLRLSRAESLLANPGASITDVAYTVGFNSPSYFARAFRNVYGVAPSKFRSQVQKSAADPKSVRAPGGHDDGRDQRPLLVAVN